MKRISLVRWNNTLLFVPAALALASILLLALLAWIQFAGQTSVSAATITWQILLAAVALAFAAASAALFQRMRRPLIELVSEQVHFRLGPQEVALPASAVECCFMGSGPSGLKGPGGQPFNSRHLVFRIAEDAATWHAAPTNSHLAKWCGGYITVFGLYTELLDRAAADRINQALAQAHRQVE